MKIKVAAFSGEYCGIKEQFYRCIFYAHILMKTLENFCPFHLALSKFIFLSKFTLLYISLWNSFHCNLPEKVKQMI